ncbi:hypothetical protein NXS19_010488 [Fusarium pseudograminearum]|uniref:Uncharacterized protein n=1 Tax=Fusarium pseudograminearum (strain CS3096) TaxID=1028729 RepID=K3UEH1_FUSPC|nr:hypothetical protein FPSE_09861 [Fusarium pseudograminearum CS3096]EKJ70016.1 hypothetical protein FPSE_09861 [Fusarium pseudograminearum CS3096]KAF0644984.1 hypothetical protein FPSE5266_09861 [Fusarium pseudograminearum]UZP42672.1 hypothetical protein NXS19_010488 [Fusarium pseudograminearum]
MAAYRYTDSDLLRLRRTFAPDREVAYKLAERVDEDNDLGEIIRTTSEHSLSLIVEESGSSSNSDAQFRQAAAQQLDGTDSERQYQDRSDSQIDRAPLVAPAGLVSQRSEGFKQFYNSVKSPTHMRVTAGGRIVPNSRGPPSPISKWNREFGSLDSQSYSRNMNGNQPEGFAYPILPPSWGQVTAMVPPQTHGTMPGMTMRPPEGYALMAPPPMAYNMAAVPYNQFPASGVPIQHPGQASYFGKPPDMGMEPARNVHLSPVEQFDPTRPFFYNGQWLLANGNNLYPINVAPQMNFVATHVPNQLAPRPSDDHMAHPAKYGRVSSRQLNPSPMNSKPTVEDMSRSASPPYSSIRPSSITQKQLEVLRSQKRYHQDQLQYNKHQIDLRDMEQRLEKICAEINKFEHLYAMQLEFEARKYPKLESPNEANSNSSAGYPHSHSDSDGPMAVTKMPTLGYGYQQPGVQAHTRSVSALGPAKPAAAVASAKNPSALKNDNGQQRKPSSLPVNAALAPVFQPRSEINGSFVATDQTDEAARARHWESMSRANASWRSSFFAKEIEAQNNLGSPYLVGKLKPGVLPQDARRDDYTYERELTADEQRARYIYWEKAPHYFQDGLPRYDGKDFYHAPDDKENSLRAGNTISPSLSNPAETQASTTKFRSAVPFSKVFQAARGSARHLFDEVTRSESLHRTDDSLRASSNSEFPRSESHAAHPGSRYMDFRRAINESTRVSSEKFQAKVSDDSAEEEGSLIFKGRRVKDRAVSSKYPSDIWSTMRKKGKTSANVVAGQVSPMTAQGVLPHYSGHATASLTPTITTNSRGHAVRQGDMNPPPTLGRREENRPPLELLEQQLRSASFQDKNPHGFSTR